MPATYSEYPNRPPLPSYGKGTVADIVGAGLRLLGADRPDPFRLPPVLRTSRKVVLYLVDGLGAEMIAAYPQVCPNLTRLAANGLSRTTTSGFPSTTVASLASVGTGLAPSQHGMLGYVLWFDELGDTVNLVKFARHGASKQGPVTDIVDPRMVQPAETAFERAVAEGIECVVVSNAAYAGSGLTVAALRGARFVGWDDTAACVPTTLAELDTIDRGLIYAYHPTLDFAGHVHGPGADQHLEELATVDGYVAALEAALPADTTLLVTGDHGMMLLPEENRIDFDADDDLQYGVRALGGEPRMRHVYAEAGNAHRVHAVWKARFARTAWVATRDEAISQGWFGPEFNPAFRHRVGDVVVAFREPYGVVQGRRDALAARLNGHHGSFTPEETAVPLLVASSVTG